MNLTDGKLSIRQATRHETELIHVEWAAKEGWNPGLHDTNCFYETDPNGFLVGFIDDKPVSCISLVKYSPDFAFLGFYIVHPDFRGKGYGYKIWKAAIDYAGSANIGLDGLVDQQENYKKSGFQLAYRNIRFKGKSRQFNYSNQNIEPISPLNFVSVLQYDADFFPAKRSHFLQNWVAQPESFAFVYSVNGVVKGIVVLRKCRTGYKTGPLFADSDEIAENLLFHALSSIPAGSDYFIDIPEVNPDALKLIMNTGIQKVFETARMYTGPFPEMDLSKIYSVTSFEIG